VRGEASAREVARKVAVERAIVVWSGQVTSAGVERALAAGAVEVLRMPAGVHEILGAFERASRA
jgi:ActR/RegA family two-component response regulator